MSLEAKNNGNWADTILKGYVAQSFAEDCIQEYWYGKDWMKNINNPLLFDISGDVYDWSLEFHVTGIYTKVEAEIFLIEKVTIEFMKFVSDNGVKRFWINFYEKEDKSSKRLFEIFVSDGAKRLKELQ